MRQSHQYDADIRCFAITLSYFSPRAYQFIRMKFGNNLPHPGTIRQWYAKSSSNGEPGISADSLEVLKALVSELKAKNEKLYATLVFDEMAIRKNVTWCESRKKFLGFINYGKIDCDEYLPIASNAIVFMLNGINVQFNLPVAHYFINNLDTSEKMFLLITVVKAITDIGLSITVITFDGLSTNITAMELLGASFDLNNMKPYIRNPIDNSKIFIMMDPPHMIKLMRNYIGSLKQMFDSTGRVIDWKFYELLELLREQKDFVTHKITKKHMNWEERKMKVSLAVQLLSNSVASSMQYLLDCGHEDFQNCEGTIAFTSRLNDLFDILNSRNDSGGGYKQPLCAANKQKVFDFLKDSVEYLKSLRISKGLLIESNKKTGVKGLLIDISSLMMFYETYVETGILSCIPVYMLNQDPLESFFGRIRSFPALGFNDNPTVLQFCSAYRKNLVKNEICTSSFANCSDKLDILYTSSSSSTAKHSNEEKAKGVDGVQNNVETELEEFARETECNSIVQLNVSSDGNVPIAYIASSIEDIVAASRKTDSIFQENDKMELSSIPNCKKIPCKSTFYLCQIAYRLLDIHSKRIDFDYFELFNSIIDEVKFETTYEQSIFSDQNYKREFIETIITNFIRIRATYIAKKLTLQQKRDMLKSKMRKQKHFAGT